MIKLDNYYINKRNINYFYGYCKSNMCDLEYCIKINFGNDNFITCSFFKREDFENALKVLNEE